MNHDLARLLFTSILFDKPQRLVPPSSWAGHIPFAFWLVDALRPSSIVELGAHSGNSYCAMCQAVARLNLECACYAVDTWEGDPQAGLYGEEVIQDLKAHHDERYSAFSRLVRCSFDEALEHFSDASVDLLHIDGFHTYQALRHDFETWLPKVSDRGVVLMHDVNVREKDFGAWQVWEELRARYPGLLFLHSHGLGALGVGKNVPKPVARLFELVEAEPTNLTAVRQLFSRLGGLLTESYEKSELMEAKAEVESHVSKLKAHVDGLSSELETCRRNYYDLQDSLDAQTKELYAGHATYQREIARLNSLLAESEGRAQGLIQDVLWRDGEVRRLSSEVALGQARADEIRNDARRLEVVLQRLEDDRERLRDTVLASEASSRESAAARDAALSAAAANVAMISRLQTELGALRGSASWLWAERHKRVLGLVKNWKKLPRKSARLAYWALSGKLRAKRAELAAARTIAGSPLFDHAYYSAHVSGLGSDPLDAALHFLRSGVAEGRDPSELFSVTQYLATYPDVAEAGVNPLLDYIVQGQVSGRVGCPFFDDAYYMAANPDLAGMNMAPLAHYVRAGAAEGRWPNALFDAKYFLEHNPDVREAGVNPLAHYIRSGLVEGRRPNALFDAAYYLAENPDVVEAGVHPLLHYLHAGAFEGRRPTPLFDSAYYLAMNADVREAGLNPLAHYLTSGAAEGRWPNALFDTKYYLEQNPDVRKAGVNPLAHYIAAGATEGRRPNALFDAQYYLEHNPDVREAGIDPLLHYLARGGFEHRWPNELFDSKYYLDHCPEARESGENPLAHYLRVGAWSGYKPNPLFDSAYYLAEHPEAARDGLNPLDHYLRIGAWEGKRTCAFFDSDHYLDAYPDVLEAGMNPLTHYLQAGVVEGRATLPLQDLGGAGGFDCVPVPARDALAAYAKYFSATPPEELSQEELDAIFAEVVELAGKHADSSGAAGADSTIDDALSDTPVISVIIPVHNQIAHTLVCLRSVLTAGCGLSYEIIIADDYSSDRTQELLASLRGVRYLPTPENLGFLKNVNMAAQNARSQYLVLLNNDTAAFPFWLDELHRIFAERSAQGRKVGLVGSMLLYPDGSLQEAGCIIWRDGSIWNYGRGDDPNKPEYNYLRAVDYCSAASVVIGADVFRALCGFDEHFAPCYAEDSDLCMRMRAAGYEVLYQPLSRVIHYEGASHGRDERSGMKAHQVENMRKLYERWEPALRYHRANGALPNRERDRGVYFRALVVDELTPTPDKDSGSITCIEFIKTLQALGVKVTFAANNLKYLGRYTKDLQRMGVEVLYTPYVTSLRDYLADPANFFHYVALFRVSVALELTEVVKQRCPASKLIFHTVDLHFLREEREAAIAACGPATYKADLREAELSVMRKAHATVVVSEHERRLLADALPGARIVNFPYVMEPKPVANAYEERSDMLFLGGFTHTPNVDAALYFLDEIFPLIKQELPDVRFHVIGNAPPPEITARAADDVIVTGYVPSLDEHFAKARLAVSPLRYGAGIKGKVVMSMAYGLPGVVTPMAVEGMDVRHEEHALIAEDAASFARAVIRVYNDAELWRTLSENSRAFVQANYSKQRATQIVQELLAD